MKTYTIFLIFLANLFGLKAQEVLFTPLELREINTYKSFNELNKNQLHVFASISDVFLYSRADSTCIAYWTGGVIKEYLVNDMWAFSPSSIRQVEYVDNNGTNDLFVLKSYEYDAQTASSSVQQFENTTRLRVFNLETHSIVFDEVIDYHFQETIYSYEEDLSQDSLSQEKISELINTREEEVEEHGFTYQVRITGEKLKIKCTQPFSGYEEERPNLKEGEFTITGKGYIKE